MLGGSVRLLAHTACPRSLAAGDLNPIPAGHIRQYAAYFYTALGMPQSDYQRFSSTLKERCTQFIIYGLTVGLQEPHTLQECIS